jgi:hypothetical protein
MTCMRGPNDDEIRGAEHDGIQRMKYVQSQHDELWKGTLDEYGSEQ